MQGNALLCGHRNGVIVTVDVREKQEGNSVRLISHRISCSPLNKTVGSSTPKFFKVTILFMGCGIHFIFALVYINNIILSARSSVKNYVFPLFKKEDNTL